ncbi:MAG: DNA polymerase III subunit delta' [Xanthomonadales bacterium]|nr:DNA polymerase III subunit delta' [Xanthomonadales bacterium]NNL96089.1 DNA polymerase III subunit delta' [Xanthomonadales bacterium]
MNTAPWLERAWQEFCDRLQSDRLAHALLIRGPQGTAKGQLASLIVSRLLCSTDQEHACGECRSCTLRETGAHPDFFSLAPEEGKHQITIDKVRDLIGQLSLTASFSPRKVALISPAEAMNASAANALLKSLEEPPGETVMVLISHDTARLPITIRSRCQNLTVATPDAAQAVSWLGRQHGLSPEEAAAALEAAGGSPLRALDLHQQGQVAAYRDVQAQLDRLRGQQATVAATAQSMDNIDNDPLWLYLSRVAADTLRAGFDRLSGASRKRLVDLQQRADRNRQFSRSSVRRDLLLQDWLIEWSRLDKS